jgi:hypothetical protein
MTYQNFEDYWKPIAREQDFKSSFRARRALQGIADHDGAI